MRRGRRRIRGVLAATTATAVFTSAALGFIAALPAAALQGPLFDSACAGASGAPGTFDDAGYAADCMKLYGIALGKNDGTFGEHDPLTRSQVASFLARLLELAGVDLGAPHAFPDVNETVVPNPQVRDEIERLAGSGVIAGFPDGTFGPAENLTVAQAATLVVRAMALISASNPDAPVVNDQGSTIDNYTYAKGVYLLSINASDMDGNPYLVEPADVTERGLLADMLAESVAALVTSGVIANRAPIQ